MQSEDGAALAEFAIMVPFLLVLLASVAEFGRYFRDYTTLTKATRAASRYLSNHQLNSTEFTRTKNLVVCGKLTCGADDATLVPRIATSNVCIESVGSPKVTSVTVRVPRRAGDCGSTATAQGGTAGAVPYVYQPIFDIGALLQTSLSLRLPIAPRTTMYYMID
jgi:Flp pilus assembly protein TadG